MSRGTPTAEGEPAPLDLPPDAPVERLPGIGPKRAAGLAAAGCATVGELLLHLPHRYEDRTTVTPLAALGGPGTYTLRGRLEGLRRIPLRRRGMSLVKGFVVEAGEGAEGEAGGGGRAEVAGRAGGAAEGARPGGGGETGDGPASGEAPRQGTASRRERREGARLAATWFNRPWLARQVDGETVYLLHGEVRPARGKAGEAGGGEEGLAGLELLNASCEPEARSLAGGRIVPVYPSAGELGPAFVRRLLGRVLDGWDPAAHPDPLPEELLERHRLPPLGEALAFLHRPPDDADVAALNARTTPAHRRLAYGELFELQLALAVARRGEAAGGRRHRVSERSRRVAREVLPFRLTGAQRRVLREIAAGLEADRPMRRLLQGDVGSGKTAVAALALVIALESGTQGAFMAPTELLAEQHHRTLVRLLGGRYRIGLFTAGNPELPSLVEALAAGEVDLAVGTHALVAERVRFPRLGLAVVDEQHRFGVGQRRSLVEKGSLPDLLVMTATPIPRSLALTAYGDLDVSLLDELPPGRRPVATEVVPAPERERVYRRLERSLAAGERAFVVFPKIGDGGGGEGEGSDDEVAGGADDLETSLAERGEALRRRFAAAGVPCAVVHGRLDPAEREARLAAFAAGEVRLLLATTVVEVGIDVPEATWMLIEGAERFGLAQLHQLRGRVGRGSRPGRCVALHGRLTDDARRRLEVFAATTDGFRLAEVDLEIRGPGELLGTRQAGAPAFRVADLTRDLGLLEAARRDARELAGGKSE